MGRGSISGSLRSLFAPRSVAIIGASEKNPWAGLVLRTLEALKFEGAIHLVNKRGEMVLGRQSVVSARDIAMPVDSAFVMVPAAAMEETLEDMAAAGIFKGVVVTSGFAEVGSEGARLQDYLFGKARSLGIDLMGPNSLGFLNFVDGVALSALSATLPLLPDPRVGVVSQSGATGGVIANTAHATNVSLTHVIAVGNEAQVDMADAIEFLIDDPAARAIALFAESARRPEAFLAAARRALEVKKPIVMLKVGVGELAAKVAQAHTGALVGDNKVFDAICRDLGIIRVDTIEQLLQTSNLLAYTGVLGDGGFGVSSLSGGACEMIADLGEANGVPFASFSPETSRKLKEILPDYATIQNPLDVTGGVLGNLQAFEDSVAIVGQDENVALVAACFDLAMKPESDVLGRVVVRHLASGIERGGVPGFLLPQSYLTVSDYARETLHETAMPLSCAGLGHAMAAVGGAFRWSAAAREGLEDAAPAPVVPHQDKPSNERETLDFLASRGVPVIPAKIARSAQEAAAIAAELGEPAVLKILSTDIAHKTEVGGVALNIAGAEAAAREYRAMLARVAEKKPDAKIEGLIVSPMRKGGMELIVGVARDPAWGLVLAVGMGGVWVELMADADLSLLPVTPHKVEKMLRRLKVSKLFDGYRGQPPVNRGRLAEVIAAIGDAALALGPDLASLEVNPLRVSHDGIECLDALAIWGASLSVDGGLSLR